MQSVALKILKSHFKESLTIPYLGGYSTGGDEL